VELEQAEQEVPRLDGSEEGWLEICERQRWRMKLMMLVVEIDEPLLGSRSGLEPRVLMEGKGLKERPRVAQRCS
jgi:hypothetical protein